MEVFEPNRLWVIWWTRSTTYIMEHVIANHVRSTRQGNVFTRVCDSVHGRGGGGQPSSAPAR